MSVTEKPSIAHIYTNTQGVLYTIDATKLKRRQSVDELVATHEEQFQREVVPADPLSGLPAMTVLRGPKGEQILNEGTGEWLIEGGIPKEAIVAATIYAGGQRLRVLRNPAYVGDALAPDALPHPQ
jgi:hypothetical protein